MNPDRFDALSRIAATPQSRRGLLAGLLAAPFAPLASAAEAVDRCDPGWKRRHRAWHKRHPHWRRKRKLRRKHRALHRRHNAIVRRCNAQQQPSPAPQTPPPAPPPSPGAPAPSAPAGGDLAPCSMPTTPQTGCVKLGGGPRPYYFEGWFCGTPACASGFCAAATLGAVGTCGATADGITTAIANGRAWVLEGSPPRR